MSRTPNRIRMAGDDCRREATHVIRGTDLDGLAFAGPAVGRIRISPPAGRTDIFQPTAAREIDPVTGRSLVVYAWEAYAPWPW